MKHCLKCKMDKDVNEFGNDKQKKDGLCTYCKACIKIRSSKQRNDNPAYFKKYAEEYRGKNREKLRKESSIRFHKNRDEFLKRSRERYSERREEIAIYRKKERQTPEFKEKNRNRIKKWRDENPGKARECVKKWQQRHKTRHSAHQRVHRAIEKGILIRGKNCMECGLKCKTEGHHEDYSKPLDVVWLCRQCHALKIEKVKV